MSVHNETVAPKSQGWRGQLVQLAGIVLVVFLAKGALAEPFYVPSGSMEPTLDIGDALLATNTARMMPASCSNWPRQPDDFAATVSFCALMSRFLRR